MSMLDRYNITLIEIISYHKKVNLCGGGEVLGKTNVNRTRFVKRQILERRDADRDRFVTLRYYHDEL